MAKTRIRYHDIKKFDADRMKLLRKHWRTYMPVEKIADIINELPGPIVSLWVTRYVASFYRLRRPPNFIAAQHARRRSGNEHGVWIVAQQAHRYEGRKPKPKGRTPKPKPPPAPPPAKPLPLITHHPGLSTLPKKWTRKASKPKKGKKK